MKMRTYIIELKELNGYYDIDILTLEAGKYSNEQVLALYERMRKAQAEKMGREMYIHAQIQ